METRNPECLPLPSWQGCPCNVPIASSVALPKLTICNFIRHLWYQPKLDKERNNIQCTTVPKDESHRFPSMDSAPSDQRGNHPLVFVF